MRIRTLLDLNKNILFHICRNIFIILLLGAFKKGYASASIDACMHACVCFEMDLIRFSTLYTDRCRAVTFISLTNLHGIFQ